jgi:hypothetical protein
MGFLSGKVSIRCPVRTMAIARYVFLTALVIYAPFTPISLAAQEVLDDIRLVISARDLELRGELLNISLSPLNPEILSFESVEGGHIHRLWWLDLSTRQLQQITPRDPQEALSDWRAQSDRDINWSPVPYNEKYWFLFVSSGSEGQENIYLGNTEDRYYLRLTSSNSVDHHPRWSPDGSRIVYVSSRTGNGDLYLIQDVAGIIDRFERQRRNLRESGNPGGGGEMIIGGISSGERHKRLTDNPEMDSYPDWSPDGRYVVYQGLIRTDDIMHMDLFLIDMRRPADEHINLTQNPLHDTIQPRWSYDQQYIAYYASPAGMGGEAPSTVYLSYIKLTDDTATGKFTSFATKGTVDRNIRRSMSAGPLWGPGSRSILYVKGEGSYTPILLFPTMDAASLPQAQVVRESRADIIHREITGHISRDHAVIAYMTYEDQDYRIYTARPTGGILSHRRHDEYRMPPPVIGTTRRSPGALSIGGSLVGLTNHANPTRTWISLLNNFHLGYTVLPAVRDKRPFSITVRGMLGTVSPAWRLQDGSVSTFRYTMTDLQVVWLFPTDALVGRTAVYLMAGLGFVFDYEDIPRPEVSRRLNVPFGAGLRFSLNRYFDIDGEFLFRSVNYRIENEEGYRTAGTRGFRLGVSYSLPGLFR